MHGGDSCHNHNSLYKHPIELVGFLSKDILEALFGDQRGETSVSSVELCTEGVADHIS